MIEFSLFGYEGGYLMAVRREKDIHTYDELAI